MSHPTGSSIRKAVTTLLLLAAAIHAQQLNIKNQCLSSVYVYSGNGIASTVDAGENLDLTSQINPEFIGNLDLGAGCDSSGNCATGGGAFNGSTPYTSIFVDYTGESTVALLYNFDLSAGFSIGVKISTGDSSCPEISCDNFKTGCPSPGPDGSCYGSCCNSVESCEQSLCSGLLGGGGGDSSTEQYYDARCPDAMSNTSWNCTNTDLLLTLCPGVTSDFSNGQAVLGSSSSSSTSSTATTSSTHPPTSGTSSTTPTSASASSSTGNPSTPPSGATNANTPTSSPDTTSTTSTGAPTSPSGNPNSDASDSNLSTKHSHVGAIAGGVVGVLVLVAVILGVWYALNQRKRLDRERERTTNVFAEDFAPYSDNMTPSSAYPVSYSTPHSYSINSASQPGSQNSREGLFGPGAAPPQIIPGTGPSRPRPGQRTGASGGEKRQRSTGPSSQLLPSGSPCYSGLDATGTSGASEDMHASSSNASRAVPMPSQDLPRPLPLPIPLPPSPPGAETEEQAQMLQEIDVLRQLVHIQEERIHHLGGGRTGARGSLAQTEAPPEYDEDDL